MSDEAAGLTPHEQRQAAQLRDLIGRALRLQCLLDDTVALIEECVAVQGTAELVAAVAAEIEDDAIPAAAVDAVLARILERQGPAGQHAGLAMAALDDTRVRVCKFEP